MTQTYDHIIRGGQVATPAGVVDADIAIKNGQIAEIGQVSGTGSETDATGLIVTPGGIDPHAHIEQMSGMGLMNADTFETAGQSALIGGTTTVISFAAQAKGQRLSDTVADYAARAQHGAKTDHAFHIIVSDTNVAEFEADLASLIADGHRSIKVFTTYNIQLDDAAILRVMQIAKQAGALVCVPAENYAMIAAAKGELISAGQTAPKYHAASHPRMAEVEAISRICHFAAYLDQPVMIFHVSTAEGIGVIRDARARGAPVMAETCPHYLLMTEDVLDRPGVVGAKWMCSPPQRTRADQEALWAALLAGDLQLVSSDHAPYRFDASGKLAAGPTPPFQDIANGLPGLEVRMPLMFDAIVSQGRGTLMDFMRLTAMNAAEISGLSHKGRIAVGADADLVLWDPKRRHTYGADDLHDNVGYNPWEGTTVTGWPVATFLRGRQVVEDSVCSAEPGQGIWQSRPALIKMWPS